MTATYKITLKILAMIYNLNVYHLCDGMRQQKFTFVIY